MTTTAGTTLKAALSGTITANAGVTTTAGALTVSQAGSVTFNATVDVVSASITSAQSIVVANGSMFVTATNANFTTTNTSIGEIKFTGMVTPTVRRVEYVVSLKRVILRKLNLGIADGLLKADGQTIYTAADLRVGLFQSTPA